MFHEDYIDWAVRCEYAMPNMSIDRSEPRRFMLHFTVHAQKAIDAWELATQAFPFIVCIGAKTYQREEMRVVVET